MVKVLTGTHGEHGMLPIDVNLINAGVIGTNWGRVHIAGLRQLVVRSQP